MDTAYLAQHGSGQQGYTTRQGTGFARDKVEITRGGFEIGLMLPVFSHLADCGLVSQRYLGQDVSIISQFGTHSQIDWPDSQPYSFDDLPVTQLQSSYSSTSTRSERKPATNSSLWLTVSIKCRQRERRLALIYLDGEMAVDAEHLMVKANVMEEVEKEFQAQVRPRFTLFARIRSLTSVRRVDSWKSSRFDIPTKRRSRREKRRQHKDRFTSITINGGSRFTTIRTTTTGTIMAV